ncbi:hypothetical protein F5Y11DRAFT_349743 [Daldinia sp. FL1419]|nr:hypothetical protein F5Y11DRAFT_349743 [Daldinia sp. FL1419]
MSKPDKYKTPAEKGTVVPGTASNSNWKPYTIPYTGAGAQRSTSVSGSGSGSNWTPQRPLRSETFAVPSHAAPPLYITNNQKKDKPADKKGKQPAVGTDKKEKKAVDETQMFKGNYIVNRPKPEDRQLP